MKCIDEQILKQKQELLKIIDLIDINDWDFAKSIWLIEILKIEPKTNTKGNSLISTFGSETQFFLDALRYYQQYELECNCFNKKCNFSIKKNVMIFILKKKQKQVK